MVRCEEFYEYFERKGNFCGKSEGVVKQVETYIDYVKRRKLRDFGGYKISNSALDPFISIEEIKDGRVHDLALKELKRLIRRRKISPEHTTRRMSIEIINAANNTVEEAYKLDRIPNIRSSMGAFEHEIGEVGFEVKEMFEALKNDIGAKNNNELMRVMLEMCIKSPEDIRKIKENMASKMASGHDIEITVSH